MGYANLSDTARQHTMQVVMDKWVGEEKDLLLVSSEGHTVYTHRSIFCLYSSILRQLVTSMNMNTSMMNVGVSVPIKANTLAKLVAALTTGIATLDIKDELLDVIEAAETI